MVRSEIKNQTKANELQRIKSLLMSRHLLANRRQKRDDSLFFQPFQSFSNIFYMNYECRIRFVFLHPVVDFFLCAPSFEYFRLN